MHPTMKDAEEVLALRARVAELEAEVERLRALVRRANGGVNI